LTQEALDRIARTAGTDGYLVGDRFSIADLTAASLLSPVLFPPECQARIFEPRAPGLQKWLARWADHPGVAWMKRIFARHRGTSAEV
jgi:glutathione S-transferase